MFKARQVEEASQLLALCRKKKMMIATAESCTGGLIAALFTEIAGSSDVFERGFVTYSNEAKNELLGVPMQMINQFGAVSPQVAAAMAQGTLQNSHAGISVAVTGIAGPGGGSEDKPVGLVYLAAASRKGHPLSRKCLFGDIGRSEVRKATLSAALELLNELLKDTQAENRP